MAYRLLDAFRIVLLEIAIRQQSVRAVEFLPQQGVSIICRDYPRIRVKWWFTQANGSESSSQPVGDSKSKLHTSFSPLPSKSHIDRVSGVFIRVIVDDHVAWAKQVVLAEMLVCAYMLNLSATFNHIVGPISAASGAATRGLRARPLGTSFFACPL